MYIYIEYITIYVGYFILQSSKLLVFNTNFNARVRYDDLIN